MISSRRTKDFSTSSASALVASLVALLVALLQ
jgi:hypothetical protein